VLNDNRHLVGRWDNSLDWLEQVWVPHAVQCGVRYWAHLDNVEAMSAQSAAALRARIKDKFEVEMFSEQAAAEAWLRSRLAYR
jgi:hypothetical protein